MLVFIATESANCTLYKYNYTRYTNDSGIEISELSFKGLDGGACNLSVTTTSDIEQCLDDIEDIEITNMSKQTYNTKVLHIQ